MPLDANIEKFLDEFGAALAFPAGARSDPQRAERFLADVRPRLNTASPEAPEPVARVHDEATDTGAGVRVYCGSAEPGHPILVYLHGGGWVSGGLEMNDGLCRRLATSTGAVVVSVDYRLAPESAYPAALSDTLEALRWTRQHAERLGGDAARLGVAGTSAGGNLAAAACLLSRDLGLELPRFQLLLYPVLDVPCDNRSYLDNARGYLLEREQMEWYWDCYLPRRSEKIPAYAAPSRCADLTGLPPAVVVSAEYDPLRDEAEDYAARLGAAGVPVELIRCDGMIHGFLSFLDAIPAAGTAADRIAGATMSMLAAPGTA